MGFQVPRVTINIDFKEGTSFGELSIISLGYGLHQAWIYSSMFDKGGIFGTSGLQAGPFNDQLSLAYFVSILVYGLLLLVASVLDTRLIRPLHATPTLVIAALLGSTGTLLLLAPDGSLLSSEALQLASGVLTGAGSSVLLLAWGIAFSRRDSASVVTNGALSIAIGFGIYGLVLHQIPFPWGGVASALIPFAEIALLLVLRRHVSLDFDNRQLIFQPLPINHARFVLRFGLPVFFLGVALGIMRQTSIETILPGSAFEDQALLFVTACAATVLIMVTFLALGDDERWHTFFRPLIPFIAVTAVSSPSPPVARRSGEPRWCSSATCPSRRSCGSSSRSFPSASASPPSSCSASAAALWRWRLWADPPFPCSPAPSARRRVWGRWAPCPSCWSP